MGASTLLKAARKSSGLGQGELAERSGTSQPDVSLVEQGKRIPTVDTLERLLSGTGHKLFAIRTSRSDAVETSARIATELKSSGAPGAFRRFLDYSDGLSASSGVDRVVLTIAEPSSTGSRLWDAALAAVAELWLDEEKLPKPGWLKDPTRTLLKPQSLDVSPYDPAPDVRNVPTQFLSRNVLVERSTLESV